MIEQRDTEYENVKFITVDGLDSPQSYRVLNLLDRLKKERPDLIIEIGTCRGGFALLLRKYFECEIVTIDIDEWEPRIAKNKQFKENNIKYIIGDCFVNKDLDNYLKKDVKKIVFCDGGHKANEFNSFSKLVNVGDIIGVHDYFPSRDKLDYNIWTTCEVEDGDLDLSGFDKVYENNAAWGLFIKQ